MWAAQKWAIKTKRCRASQYFLAVFVGIFFNFLKDDACEKRPVLYPRTNCTTYHSSESPSPALESTQHYYSDVSACSSRPPSVQLSVSSDGGSPLGNVGRQKQNETPVSTHQDTERLLDAHAPLRSEEVERVLVGVEVAPWDGTSILFVAPYAASPRT